MRAICCSPEPKRSEHFVLTNGRIVVKYHLAHALREDNSDESFDGSGWVGGGLDGLHFGGGG